MMRWGGGEPIPREVVVVGLGIIAAGLFLAVVLLFTVAVTS